jgi:hypothetical protein
VYLSDAKAFTLSRKWRKYKVAKWGTPKKIFKKKEDTIKKLFFEFGRN